MIHTSIDSRASMVVREKYFAREIYCYVSCSTKARESESERASERERERERESVNMRARERERELAIRTKRERNAIFGSQLIGWRKSFGPDIRYRVYAPSE